MGAMDELINAEVVARLRTALGSAAPAVALPSLERAATALPGLGLRQRVDAVRDALLADLPEGFPAAQRIMLDLLGEPHFAGWMIWPATEVVTSRALASGSAAHFDAAMDLLARMTVGLTGEFAIRDLLIARPERALGTMLTWGDHDDENVRRLATEGSRAYLPWAKRVPWLLAHPRATLGILDATYRDPAEYVRRSVANHLNDLSRVDPAVVVEAAGRWAAQPVDTTPGVLRHGLRTLVKKANPDALALLGFSGAELSVATPRTSADVIPWGGALEFTAEVTNDGGTAAVVAIDYSIGFRRANGSASPKTFKLGVRTIPAGGTVAVTKTHSFRAITTRAYYAGAHFVTVQANGAVSPRADFTLGGEGS